MREQAFRFGRAGHLVGIAGLPATAGAPGVIVLNAGMVHRVGPFRLHVELTRRFNASGYPTLRFDLSTRGDSGADGQPLARVDQVLADVSDAMDLLAAEGGCTRFVLLGLCSGAADAHRVACDDPRVAGAVFIDGYVYRTLGYRLRHYLPRLCNVQWVLRYLGNLRKRVRTRTESVGFKVSTPPKAQVRGEYADMLARGLMLYFIYSGGISRYFNHARQFGECYGRLASHPGVSMSYLAGTDHTYVLACDRRLLIEGIAAWLETRFPVHDTALR